MAKIFLKLGIDHGTSNSSICVMEPTGPRVIRVDGADEIMPSVVYMDRSGRVIVGAAARKAMLYNPPQEGDGHAGYKIKIGQDDRYDFRAAGKSLSAPELGGLVMGYLLRAYRDVAHEEIPGAVITVPAKFEHNACEGTREAARHAGLKFFPQIQEPIAASMAYGFTATDRRAQWMVFDLGGGTLDVSLVYVRGGRMDVPEEGHAGDNRLGGRKFDREILAYVLGQLKKQYALATFSEGNPAYTQAWGRLMMACEQAKIQLSTRSQAVVEVDGVLCQDDQGKDVLVEIPIERSQYVAMIAPEIQKAIHLCRTLLEGNRLTPKDLDRIILIGGPTKTPYVQTALAEGLGLEVKPTIDPMTAVAVGAALHAATVELPEEHHPSVRVTETIAASFVSVRLEYERTPQANPCFIAGKVEGEIDPASTRVEIRRSDGWSSGDIPVAEDGTFTCDVALIDEGTAKLSSFETRVFGKGGELLASSAEPQILYPYRGVEGRLANSLLIATEGNRTVTLVKKGSSLPGKGSERFVTTKPLQKGSGDDVLNIAVLEGVTNLFGEENSSADLNVHIGSLVIKGDNERLTHDLPAGSRLRITVHQDESRAVHCVAYVDLLDDEFEGEITREGFEIDSKSVAARFATATAALEDARALDREYPTPGVDQRLRIIDELKVVEEIAKETERAQQGEKDALYRAYRRVLELAGALQIIAEAQTEAHGRRHIGRLRQAVRDKEAQDLDAVEAEFDRAVREKDTKALARTREALTELDHRVRARPYFSVCLALAAVAGKRGNQRQIAVVKEADALIGRVDAKGGVGALTASDLSELEAMHRKLLDVLPELPKWIEEFLKTIPDGTPPGTTKNPYAHVKKETASNY
ncbi:MAG TPA: Hsp70 family protein [Verrucomicrobiota bacterium]|nr:Hsp70 family protein [Verrucomicrobiota bacterium]HNU50824.1 Hsp70 family protein [Verrucomicrobiota bacterium]